MRIFDEIQRLSKSNSFAKRFEGKRFKTMPMAGTKSPLHGSELFLNKKNRDDRYNELKGMGKSVTRSTVHNQRLDPRYVEDSGKTKDLGMGNDYQHFYPKLFGVKRKIGINTIDDYDYAGPTVEDIQGKRVKREWNELRGY